MRRIRSSVPAAALFLATLAVWEATVRFFGIQGFILPAPSAIAIALVEEWSPLRAAAVGTFGSALAGLAVGMVAAVVVGMAVARWKPVRDGVMPLAVAANSTPIVVLAPISIAWFGLLSPWSTISVVAVLVFFPIMINLVRGLGSATAAHHELMQSYATNRRQVLVKLQLPTALPYLFSAFKVAAALSLIGAIVKEYFGGSQDRLGQYITRKAGLFQFEEAWSAIVVLSAFGVVLFVVIGLIERRVMPWHVSVRSRR